MNLKRPIKIAGLLILFLVSTLPADAQSVIHLGTGDSYLFSRPTLVDGKIDEVGRTASGVLAGFTGDLFTAGDSLQIDLFTTPTSPTPLATSTVSNPPWTDTTGAGNNWLGIRWDSGTGAVRLTMLSGSVDVSSLQAVTYYRFEQLSYSYTIPEPSTPLLLAPGLLWLFFGSRQSGRNKK